MLKCLKRRNEPFLEKVFQMNYQEGTNCKRWMDEDLFLILVPGKRKSNWWVNTNVK